MMSRIACGMLAATLLFAAPLAAQSESADSLALGRKYTNWFFDGHADSLWSMMGDSAQVRVGSEDNIVNMMDQVLEQIGEEAEVVSEVVYPRDDGVVEYRRTSEFDAAPEPVVWIWRINPEGMIVGASIRPASQAPPPPSD